MQSSLRLPFEFEPEGLQADLRRILAEEFVPHFNTAYYQGDWSVVPFRSVGGRANHIYPYSHRQTAYADTPLLPRCAYIQRVLAAFPCPQQAVRFLRLKPGSMIKEHTDYCLSYEDGEVRLHIPVQTNPEVEFILNGVRIDMKEGECWYHDFNRPHSVANRGDTDRVHLVIDCVVNDWLREVLLAANRGRNR